MVRWLPHLSWVYHRVLSKQHVVAVILLDELEKAHEVNRPRSGV
jgi:hypothetical protein